METKNNTIIRIAITGLTYSGKSTTIEALKSRGYQTTPEAARIIIERELKKESDCLPWKNIQKFQNEVSNLQYSLEDTFSKGVVFSDRSLIDGHAHSIVDNIIVPEVVMRHSRDRYSLVFFLEQIPNYRKDSVRSEDTEKLERLETQFEQSYKHFGYSPIFVPVMDPGERADFILDVISIQSSRNPIIGGEND
jgi:predicted ATPase